MKKTLLPLLALSLLAASCITVAPKTRPTTGPLFVTSTLPPTHSLVTRPTATRTGLPVTPTLAVTVPADCKVVAVLLEDVTIPDGTQVSPGKSFTKTWKIKNTGTCPWSGYSVAFASGDRMGAPDTSPVAQTLAADSVDVSVDLVAPSADGTYTGFFELQDADGDVVPIGLEKTFWVKIRVGAGGEIPSTPATPGGTVSPTQMGGGGGDCQISTNPGYVSELLSLLNEVRASAGVPALSLNAQLTAAAQAHSADQACHNFISHVGSDGSSIQERIAAAGYSSSYSIEIIAVGGPQDAIAQWSDDALHRNAMIDRNATEVGIGWADSPNSVYGGHFTVVLASP